ncbi:hypothetical protein BC937DRAFT_88047 [Endogone sp. FLAS-F59071]|nr:hypothetical protein BC937DRAFT_88047 [Endogone sp. FLAS-F59071]|eukprot:RUS19039.1 hypothetical protein BC937DRAFT_88047 [Endogone sp. FLAS-F59071]
MTRTLDSVPPQRFASSSNLNTENDNYKGGIRHYKRRKYATAIEHFSNAVKEEHIPSLNMLGLCEKANKGDPVKAYQWFKKSANHGGQFELGKC